jgi:hypothetical protein
MGITVGQKTHELIDILLKREATSLGSGSGTLAPAVDIQELIFQVSEHVFRNMCCTA